MHNAMCLISNHDQEHHYQFTVLTLVLYANKADKLEQIGQSHSHQYARLTPLSTPSKPEKTVLN